MLLVVFTKRMLIKFNVVGRSLVVLVVVFDTHIFSQQLS